MNAGRQWIGEGHATEPRPADRDRRDRVDLDRLVEVATVVGGVAMIYGGAAFYLGGAATLAYLLGGWVGALLLAGFGMPAGAYSLVKWHQRKADQAIRTDARHTRETGGSSVGYQTFGE